MANCQNNVRYGRQSGNWQQRQSRQSCGNNAGTRTEAERVRETCRACETNRTRETCGTRETRQTCETSGSRETGRTHETCEKGRTRETRTSGCGREDKLQGFPLAMAYVPWQNWGNLYCACKALQAGTVFEELDKPFLGRGGCNR